MQEKISFRMTKPTLETWLADTEARPDAALTEMTAHTVRLRDKVDHLSSDWSVLSVAPKTISL